MTNNRYPRADMPNAVSTLRMLRFTLVPGSQDEVTDIVQYDLVTSLQVTRLTNGRVVLKKH